MGRSGTRYGLSRIPGREVADASAVAGAVLDALWSEWSDALYRHDALRAAARRWLRDTITVDVEAGDDGTATSFIVLFYDSVPWPLDLANHLAQLAFVTGRLAFDGKLAEVGYAFIDDGVAIGTVLEIGRRPRRRFFAHDGKLGLVEGDEIYDSYPEQEATPVAALAPADQERLAAFRAGTHCECPYCAYVAGEFSISLPRALAGYVMEPVLVMATNNVVRWVAADGLYIAWVDHTTYGPIVHATRDFEHFRRAFFPGVATAQVHGLVATVRGGRAWFLALLDVGWFGTADGIDWIVEESAPRATHLARDGENGIWAWGDALHRSEDGGRTWHARAAPPGEIAGMFGSFAITESDGTRALFAHDGSWKKLAAFDFRADVVLEAPGALLVTGTAPDQGNEPASAVLVRSTDGGATWTTIRRGRNTHDFQCALAHPDGRLFWSPYQVAALQVSTDAGATFAELFYDYQPAQLLLDPANPGAVLAAGYSNLVRIQPR